MSTLQTCVRDKNADQCAVETRGRTLEEMARLFGVESQLAQRSGIALEKDDIHAVIVEQEDKGLA